MKDAVSRILVELMKRVWPQLWADLFQKLYDICQHGVSVSDLFQKLDDICQHGVGVASVPSVFCCCCHCFTLHLKWFILR